MSNIFGDYHTHTVYSHGSGSVMENIAAAVSCGLKEIAITDHGMAHKAYGIRRMDLADYIADIEAVRTSYPDIKIYRGVESNILNSKGDIDVSEADTWVDILLCGHHKYVKGAGVRESLTFNFPVFLAGLAHKSTAKRTVANTDAFIKAMERHPIDVITHPNLAISVDMKEMGRAAAHFGVFLELNGKGVRFSPAAAHAALNEGAQFIVDSDAHSSRRVGDFLKVIPFIESAQIPHDRIVNYGKIPIFRRHKGQ